MRFCACCWMNGRAASLGGPLYFVDTRTRPGWGDQALRVLAAEAPSDEIAARTLLQALLGGLVRLATQVAHDDPDAVGEVVSMAWNRVRTLR